MARSRAPRTHWTATRRLFHALVDLEPAAREPLLARHADAPDVVAEVRSLLDWHQRDPSFFDGAGRRPAASVCTTLGATRKVRGPDRSD